MIILDIETKNLEAIGDGIVFGHPANWNTSCVCTLELVGPELTDLEAKVFVNHKDLAKVKDAMPNATITPLNELRDYLNNSLEDGLPLLTHNGDSFDLPILSKSLEDGGAGCAEVIKDYIDAGLTVDTCADLKRWTGKRFHLQDLIQGVLGSNASKLMSGANAPKEWNAGNYAGVIEYCLSDSSLTYQMFCVAAQQGFVEANASKETNPTVVATTDWQGWLDIALATTTEP